MLCDISFYIIVLERRKPMFILYLQSRFVNKILLHGCSILCVSYM